MLTSAVVVVDGGVVGEYFKNKPPNDCIDNENIRVQTKKEEEPSLNNASRDFLRH